MAFTRYNATTSILQRIQAISMRYTTLTCSGKDFPSIHRAIKVVAL